MADRFFMLSGAFHRLPDGASMPDGAVEVPRLPETGERWDLQAGAFVLDGEIAADMDVPAGHIERAHIIKTVEASLILSGVRLSHGLIADEAEETGLEIEAIAAMVAENDAGFRAIERERRGRKNLARKI